MLFGSSLLSMKVFSLLSVLKGGAAREGNAEY